MINSANLIPSLAPVREGFFLGEIVSKLGDFEENPPRKCV